MNDTGQKSFSVPERILQGLSQESQSAVARFLAHQSEPFDLSKYPVTKLAAVLVLLYEKHGQVYVLLTTRSKKLRSHPGQTALPGGKCDDADASVIETAYREANEEVGLPLNSPSVHALCVLRPFLSLYRLVVTPVVAWLSDLNIILLLKRSESEVERIFEHPLKAILDPSKVDNSTLVPKGNEDWPYEDELHNTSDSQGLSNTVYRMHRFRSSASPIKGLTADILIMAAEVAYARRPVYDRWAPGQADTFSSVSRILDEQEEMRRKAIGLENGSDSKHASRDHLPAE